MNSRELCAPGMRVDDLDDQDDYFSISYRMGVMTRAIPSRGTRQRHDER
jgi:hypothetical protein